MKLPIECKWLNDQHMPLAGMDRGLVRQASLQLFSQTVISENLMQRGKIDLVAYTDKHMAHQIHGELYRGIEERLVRIIYELKSVMYDHPALSDSVEGALRSKLSGS